MKVVTPEEMAVMDRRTIKAGISDYELMEKAGTRCARIIMDEIEEDARVLVLCGAGNNGGDGQVIARQLANGGWKVRVLFTSDASKMTPSSERNYARLKEIGVPCVFYEELNKKVQGAIDDCDVLVDAVFGNGLKDRPLYDKIARLFTAVNASGAVKYAVDMPSGLRGTVGKTVGCAIRADRTLVIQCMKTGGLLGDGPDYLGRATCVDVGISEATVNTDKYLLTADTLPPHPERKKNSHKYQMGSVAVVAGSPGMIGAGILASTAALRSGAGLVTTLCDERIYPIMAVKMPPEIMVRTFTEGDLADQLDDRKKDVILFGPGMGRDRDYSGVLLELMGQVKPVVLDADGLFHLHPVVGALKNREGGPVVLTPHLGEFAALTGLSKEDIEKDPIGIGGRFASLYRVILVLKGHHTMIFSPEGEVWFNTTGNAGMATAGSGDVLAGMTAGFIPQYGSVLEAVKAAVYYHGAAGDDYADRWGETTLVAGDLIDGLKNILR